MRKIIFVGGIHGVGKSYLCDRLSRSLKLPHYSCSGLLKLEKDLRYEKNKQVSDIDDNQKILIEAISKHTPRAAILLDGHFCLMNSKGSILSIPEVTFQEIGPAGIIVVTDEADRIRLRLTDRDGMDYDAEFLYEFQLLELQQSEAIASSLGIPRLIVPATLNAKNIETQVSNAFRDILLIN